MHWIVSPLLRRTMNFLSTPSTERTVPVPFALTFTVSPTAGSGTFDVASLSFFDTAEYFLLSSFNSSWSDSSSCMIVLLSLMSSSFAFSCAIFFSSFSTRTILLKRLVEIFWSLLISLFSSESVSTKDSDMSYESVSQTKFFSCVAVVKFAVLFSFIEGFT